MRSNNLLIITNNFPNVDNSSVVDIFVKEQIKSLKKYFQTIYVISPVAYGMELLRKTTYKDYQYDNVKVFFPKYFNVPFFYTHLRFMWVDFEAKAILKLIENEGINFDLIHAHFTWPSGTVAIELKKKFRVPVVITEHTHISLYKELETKNKQYIDTLKLCDAVIRVNRKDIPLLVNHGVSAQKVFNVANGFDPVKFKSIPQDDARRKLGLKNDMNIIFNVSRLSEEKGQKYLIDTIYEVVKTRNDVLCIIGGYGPLKDKLQTQINNLNLQDHVMLIGFVSDELLSIWMHACDVFVLPSLSEGNPTVMFECLGCGKPFVGTKVGGVPEIIISDDYGLLCDPAKPKELAENILLALDKSWDEEKILYYAEQYRWENIAEQIQQIYCHVLQTKL